MKSSKPIIWKRPLWRNKILLVLVVLLLAGGVAAWYFLGTSQAQAKSGLQTAGKMGTATVQHGNIEVTASGSGTLVASQSVDLSFSTSGTVGEVKVKLGDIVKTGDVLASLENTDKLQAEVVSAQLALLQAQQTLTDLQGNADVALAQAYQDWATAQETYTTTQDATQRAESTARCSQEVNTKYKTALDRATEVLNNLHAELQDSDAYINAKNNYATALANYNYCISYTDDEKTVARSNLEVAKSALATAEEKYNTLKKASGIDPTELALDEAKVKTAQTNLEQAKENLAGATLTAPIDGRVIYLAASAGTIVDTSKFITIADVTHPTINVSVDETDMDKMKVGNTATVTFDALDGQTFTGKVVQANPQLTTSGQYSVQKGLIQLDDNTVKTVSQLPLGLSATVTISGGKAENVLLVPATAVKSQSNGTYTVTVVSGGQKKQTTVTIGLENGDYAEITSGLKEGEVVSTGVVSSSSSSSSSSNQNQGGMMPPDGGGMMPPQ